MHVRACVRVCVCVCVCVSTHRGGLKLGILINEVGEVDLDSQLINVSHVHAAHGLPAPVTRPGESQLAGGCVCCSAAGGLSESLSAMREASVGQLDYLVSSYTHTRTHTRTHTHTHTRTGIVLLCHMQEAKEIRTRVCVCVYVCVCV